MNHVLLQPLKGDSEMASTVTTGAGKRKVVILIKGGATNGMGFRGGKRQAVSTQDKQGVYGLVASTDMVEAANCVITSEVLNTALRSKRGRK